MRRSTQVSLSITAGMALALSGCGSSVPDNSYQAVCVDRSTNKRIDDRDCDRGYGGYGWYYYPMYSQYAGVGQTVSGGSYAAPRSGNYVRGGASRTGGKVSTDSISSASSAKGAKSFSSGKVARGGFGGSAKGGSSGG